MSKDVVVVMLEPVSWLKKGGAFLKRKFGAYFNKYLRGLYEEDARRISDRVFNEN